MGSINELLNFEINSLKEDLIFIMNIEKNEERSLSKNEEFIFNEIDFLIRKKNNILDFLEIYKKEDEHSKLKIYESFNKEIKKRERRYNLFKNIKKDLEKFKKFFEEEGGILTLNENFIEFRIDGYLYECINYENDFKLESLKSDLVEIEFYSQSIIHIY